MPRYWKLLRALMTQSRMVVVGLGGLHYPIGDSLTYVYTPNGRRNMLVSYINWSTNEYVDTDHYAAIECDTALLKTLYERHWFALAREVHMRIAFAGTTVVAGNVVAWAAGRKRRINAGPGFWAVCDNQHNGVHFRIEGVKLGKVRIARLLGAQM